MPDEDALQQDSPGNERQSSDSGTGVFTLHQDGTLVGPDGAKYVPLKRFSGLQARFTELQSKHNSTVEQLNAQITEVQGELEALRLGHNAATSEVEQFKNLVSERDARISELESKVSKATAAQERQKMIADNYPDLLSYEAKGLLRTDIEGEDLTRYLDNFRTTLQGKVETEITQRVAGATPPSSRSASSTPSMSRADIIDKMMGLAGSRDPKDIEEFQRLEKLIDEAPEE